MNDWELIYKEDGFRNKNEYPSEDVVSYVMRNYGNLFNKEEISILEIGSGWGNNLTFFKDKGFSYVGVDISQTAVDAAKKKGVNAKVFDLFNDDMKKLGDFDYITMFEVLEHIPNAEEAMLKIKDAFKSKTCFFSIPNTGSLYDRARLLIGRFPKQWVVHPSEHLRFWTLNDFKFALSYLDIELITPIAIHNRFSW